MCGDLCCATCGPAQGNWTCPICGEWASEGCEHLNARGDGIKPAFQEQARRIVEAEYWNETQAAEDWEQECKEIEEYVNEQKQTGEWR